MAAEPIDENVVNVTPDLPEKLAPYVDGGYWLDPVGTYCLYLPEPFKLFCDTKAYAINVFPINVGCDELIPGLVT